MAKWRESHGITKRAAVCRNGHPRLPETTDKKGSCLVCRRLNKKALAERRKRDATATANLREYDRIYQEAHRRAAGVPARNWRPPKDRTSLITRYRAEVLDAAAFLAWWEAYRAANPLLNALRFVEGAGFDLGVLRHAQGNGHIHLDHVDKALVQAGEPPDTLRALYPWPADPEREIEASVETVLLLPDPVPTPLRIVDTFHSDAEDDWMPPRGMFASEHRKYLMRARGEFGAGRKRRRHQALGTPINGHGSFERKVA